MLHGQSSLEIWPREGPQTSTLEKCFKPYSNRTSKPFWPGSVCEVQESSLNGIISIQACKTQYETSHWSYSVKFAHRNVNTPLNLVSNPCRRSYINDTTRLSISEYYHDILRCYLCDIT